jgi:FkbM family methyltransferase
MSDNNIPLQFKLGNYLFKYAYPVYRPLYFLYKKISDSKKMEILSGYIKPGMAVLDIGANIGFYSLFFSELVGEQGKVYAIEPDPVNFTHLKKSTSDYKNIITIEKAVGETTGKLRLYYSPNLNVDHQTYDIGEGRKYLEVDSISLDDYLPKDIGISLIKIDIQGFDFQAMKGMQGILERSGNLMILGELWPYGLQRAGSGSMEYMDYLRSKGFTIEYFEKTENDFEDKNDEKNFYTDFIATKG